MVQDKQLNTRAIDKNFMLEDRGLLYYTQNVPNPAQIQTGEMALEETGDIV